MNKENFSKNDVPIDFPSALERTGGDESFLYELINLYIGDFTGKFDEIQNAIRDENFDMIQELGHSLKGSSANLSLIFLQEASYDMEMAGREKNTEKAKNTLILLEQEFQRLKDFLSKKKVESNRQ